MVDALQLIGVAYVLFMVYLTFLYYKRNNYSVQSFVFWVVVWAVGGVLVLFPNTTGVFLQQFHVARVIDFYLILGLMFFSAICFINFVTTRRTEEKVEELVRKIAIRKGK